MNTPEIIQTQAQYPIPEELINTLGHVICVGALKEGDEGFNKQIDVLSTSKERDRAQVYQMWTVDVFSSNSVALGALQRFGLAGENAPDKEKWTQLLEHIAGVTAITIHLEKLLEKHGATKVDQESLTTAALFNNIDKPEAVAAAIDMGGGSILVDTHPRLTAPLVHDLGKPAELAAGGGGLENSRNNPVLREGKLWLDLSNHGVSDDIILAAQNTGRSDRFFSELEDYDDNAKPKAMEDRDALATLLGIPREAIDHMTPTERRHASIEAKGRAAAIVGIADALAAQFRFKGMSEQNIDAMAEHYLTYKKDPESVQFFGKDWREYYKEVRRYLTQQVPEENRPALEAELDSLTHEIIFNETVLPSTLGSNNKNAYNRLRYPIALAA
jgi:hypothetical protein